MSLFSIVDCRRASGSQGWQPALRRCSCPAAAISAWPPSSVRLHRGVWSDRPICSTSDQPDAVYCWDAAAATATTADATSATDPVAASLPSTSHHSRHQSTTTTTACRNMEWRRSASFRRGVSRRRSAVTTDSFKPSPVLFRTTNYSHRELVVLYSRVVLL